MSESNEFKPRLKSPKNLFQLSAGLNLEKFNTILSGMPNLSRGSNSLNSASGLIWSKEKKCGDPIEINKSRISRKKKTEVNDNNFVHETLRILG